MISSILALPVVRIGVLLKIRSMPAWIKLHLTSFCSLPAMAVIKVIKESVNENWSTYLDRG